MSWLAVAVGGTMALSSIYAGKQQQALNEAETRELQAQQKSEYNAIQQAQLDKQREIDMATYQQDREARRAEANARAGQANTGIAGITAGRQIDNVLFQSVLDENFIKTQGENALINIRNEGQSMVSSTQSKINAAKRGTQSSKNIYISGALSGVSGFLSAGGASQKSGGSSSSSSSSSSSGGSK